MNGNKISELMKFLELIFCSIRIELYRKIVL